MSFPRFRPLTSAFALAVVLAGTSRADAQLFGNHCSSCNAQPVAMMAPVQQVAMSYDPCNVCAQPQQQVVYRTVPVTEYQQVAQTVRKPIVETAYEDRQFTEYRTVYEQRTAQVPTVSYQNVTECQTVSRDMGRWCTYQQPVAKVSPCQYDNSAGLLGMFNRTGYQIRSAFTPNVITRRQYVPNVVAYQVPVTRQVATRGVQTVNYQVARIEPYTVTKQVAVRKVRYEDEQVVAMRPVTTYRTVPIGTQTAYGFIPFQNEGSSVTAQATPDPISTKSAQSPTPVQKRTAENDSKFENKKETKSDGGGFSPFPAGSSNEIKRSPVQASDYEQTAQLTHSSASSAKPALPSMIRVAGWRARATQPETSPLVSGTESSGPSLQVVKATP